MDLKDKLTIVTGAAAGLGRATALAYARRGARLVAVDVDGSGLAETARTVAEAGQEIVAVAADLAVEEDVERVMAATERRFGRLDVLVHCAAILLDAGTRVDAFSTEA